jgi:hypothetical protein
MDADKTCYERLVGIAALAHRRCVAANLSCALCGLYSADYPMQDGAAKLAERAAALADNAVADWRERHAAD